MHKFAFWMCSAAFAAGAGPIQAAETTDKSLALDEIIVTATRQEKPLQKVPASVAVISAESIQKSGSVLFGDLGFQVANFVTDTSGHNPLISSVTVRGISGRAAVYLDDVIIGSSTAYNTSLLDVERVEVLRGPQGITFGANTLAGAINTITRKPSLSESEGKVKLTGGSHGSRQIQGYVTGPVSDKLALKITGFYRKSDGHDQDVRGKRYNGDNEAGLRAAALYEPSTTVRILLTYDHSKLDLENAFIPELYAAPAGSIADGLIKAGELPNYRDPTQFKVFGTTDPNAINRTINGVSARVDLQFGSLNLTSLTAYREANSYTHKDEDYVPLFLAFNDAFQRQNQFSQEIRANGSIGRAKFLSGLYYFRNKTNEDSTIPLSGTYLSLVGLSPDLFVSLGLPARYSTGGAIFQATADERDTETFAAYSNVTIPIGERLEVNLGARYTTERVQGSSGTASSNLPSFALAFLPGFVYGTQARPSSIVSQTYPEIRSNRLDPAASVSYALTDHVNVYSSASSGYRSPSYNSLSNCSAPSVNTPCIVRRETGTNFEAGVKSEWLDNRLRVNLVAYLLKLKDAQLSQTVPQATGPFLSKTVNSDETSKGVELEFAVRPLAGLSIDGSLGLQDASYDNYQNAYIQFDRGATAPAYCYRSYTDIANGYCIGDATGQTLPFAPRYTGGIAVAYEAPINRKYMWYIRAEAQHRSSYNFQLGTATVTRVAPTNLLNVSVGINPRDGSGLGLTLRGRNITNEKYFTNAAVVPTGETYVYLNKPSWWSFDLTYSF